MKKLIKNSIYLLLLFALACGDKSRENQTETHMHSHDDEHVHTYACPMHPDVTGKEGDRCSKCGMLLEHNDDVQTKGNYKMEFLTPLPVNAGEPVTLRFRPSDLSDTTALVPLDVEHEKKIHLIIVSNDLEWFNHTHPDYQSDGSYAVTETFPFGGNYIMYADYKPAGGQHMLDKISLDVTGKSKPSPGKFHTESLTAESGNYSVVLQTGSEGFTAGSLIHFNGKILKEGKSVNAGELQNYLGAKGHMVAVHSATKEYIHIHPEVENNMLHFQATFPEKGIYRVWLQFMADDSLHTVDFALNAAEGNGTAAHHEDHSHSHSH